MFVWFILNLGSLLVICRCFVNAEAEHDLMLRPGSGDADGEHDASASDLEATPAGAQSQGESGS